MGDAGWRIFYMLNTERLCPSHGRWLLILNQFPALWAIKAGVSLKSALMLHSIGNVLIFGVVFALCYVSFTQSYLALAILLSYVFGLGSIYFEFPDLEMHLASPLLIFLGFHLKFSKMKEWKKFIVSVPFILLLSLSHPMVLFTLSLLIILQVLRCSYTWRFLYFALLVLALLLKFFTSDLYEAVKVNNIVEEGWVVNNLSNFSSLVIGRPMFFLLLIVIACLFYLNKEKVQLILYTLGAIVYVFVIVFFVPVAHYYPYLIPFTALSIYLLFQEINYMKITLYQWKKFGFIFTLLIFSQIAHIYYHKDFHKDKIMQYSAIVKKALEKDQSKVVVDNTHGISMNYSIAESAIISALLYQQTVVVVGFKESEQRRQDIKRYLNNFELDEIKVKTPHSLSLIEELYEEDFLDPRQKMSFLNDLNPNYFVMKDRPFIYFEEQENLP